MQRGMRREVRCEMRASSSQVLGGPPVACEVVRGHKAPVKTVRVLGAGADLVYHRLLMAHKYLHAGGK